MKISEQKHNHEKELEERLRSAIREEFQKKKIKTRKKAGLILSGIGGIIYLINGALTWGAGWGFNILSTPYLITGIILQIGTLIGSKKIKLGGTVILLSIPFSIIFTLISSIVPYYSLYMIFIYLLFPVYPIPFISGVLVIVGGILCLMSSDEEVSEQENRIKNN